MTAFRGPKNIQLGHPVWASAQYDAVTRDYVVTVDGEDVDRFRKVAELYDFREVPDGEPEPPHDPPADDEGGSDDVPDPEPGEGDGHEREYVDLAHAIDNARDDDELDESDDDEGDEGDDPDPEPEPTPAKPKPRTRRRN
jgi:hypothetical protein